MERSESEEEEEETTKKRKSKGKKRKNSGTDLSIGRSGVDNAWVDAKRLLCCCVAMM